MKLGKCSRTVLVVTGFTLCAFRPHTVYIQASFCVHSGRILHMKRNTAYIQASYCIPLISAPSSSLIGPGPVATRCGHLVPILGLTWVQDLVEALQCNSGLQNCKKSASNNHGTESTVPLPFEASLGPNILPHFGVPTFIF